jgi:hypothetical protein
VTTRAARPSLTPTSLIERPGDWAQDGSCAGSPEPDIWHADDTHRDRESDFYSSDVTLAIRICKGCPVRLPCLEYALGVPQASDWGVWGATTAAERRAMRKQGRRAA